MRILVLNGNTTEAITAACVAAARDAAAPATEIIGATPAFGPTVISTRAENAIAGHAILATLAEHAGGIEAAILAVSHDTALDAARQLMPCPVIGMTEAACLTACLVGGQFGVLTLGQARPYEELVARHGLAARCAAVVGLPLTPQQAIADPAAAEAQVLAATTAMAERCDSVVLAGAALAGLAARLQDRAAVPLLDGIACAVKLAEALAALHLPKPRTGSFAAPAGRTGLGLSPALAALLSGG
ncbi:aspartate/glutamate racemase family protein [Falsiroseomonas selenitidurans]|uniref:Hydantoin racemase n=1 Tax=Falsiroseomonas selenitidurans TaxID=2716335 RepID=A0ABX1E0K7_9PROT|nr:aspartate/glutamate racemase family protein [Falsiroseomonas selenitidurans]NKC30691.1 hydantoin racemase [Falsiroseomonas selenitidurans]